MQGHKKTSYIKAGLLASALVTTQTNAQNANGVYSVIGRGLESCGKFTTAANEATYHKNRNNWNTYLTYTQGYLTGLNQYLPDNRNILGGTDVDGAMAFLEKYCRENPLAEYIDALENLTDELYPKRSR